METLKLISLRIDRDTLATIDKIARDSGIMKRSWVINNLLKACVDCSTPGILHKMATEFDPLSKGYSLEFRVSEDKIHHPHYYEV